MKKALLMIPILAVVAYFFYPSSYDYVETPPLQWMKDQVQSDFQAYESGIKQTSFDKVRQLMDEGKLIHLYLVTIDGNGVSTYPKKLTKRSEMIVVHLKRLVESGAKVPHVTFVLGNEDAWTYPERFSPKLADSLPPVFVFAADKTNLYRRNYILFPDDHTLGSHLIGYRKGWARIYKDITHERDMQPWHGRKDMCFWRGLPTDTPKHPMGESPRTRLVQLSADYPDLINAKFTVTYGNQLIKRTIKPLLQMFSIPPYASHAKQLEYKILPCLDGYSSTFPGLLWRLASGSVVLKQTSNNQQWFYNMLRPYEDYVPIKNDMSDVVEVTKWVLDNPENAEKIALNAVKTVEENLEPKHIDAYILLVLNKYKTLMRKE